MVQQFLTGGATKASHIGTNKASKKIKKQKSSTTSKASTLSVAAPRKMSFSTHYTEGSSVASLSSPIHADIYNNYNKSRNLYSSRKPVESPILYRAEMLESEQENNFSEEEDKISFFNFSNDSTRSDTADELESLDFIFCKGNDNEPNFEQVGEVRQSDFEMNCEFKTEVQDDSYAVMGEKHMSWIQRPAVAGINGHEFSVGCVEPEISIFPNFITGNSVHGDLFEDMLSYSDRLL